jgi:hypothetical protein
LLLGLALTASEAAVAIWRTYTVALLAAAAGLPAQPDDAWKTMMTSVTW